MALWPLLLLLVMAPAAAQAPGDLSFIHLPPGFRIDYWSRDVPGARSLALGDRGTLFVGTNEEGNVYALVDERGEGRATRRYIVASGLQAPEGVTYLNGDLYVAERRRVLRYRGIESRLHEPPRPEVVYDHLPDVPHYLRAGPDGQLYVGVGAPCESCLREGFANISRLRPDGSGFEPFARGVRNSVGFDWHPVTEEFWFTDDSPALPATPPPDELNRTARPGRHFGFPFCHGEGLPDPQFGCQRPCSDFQPPALTLVPGAGALGIRFYTGFMFPEPYRHQIFIAEHGPREGATRNGYRLALVRLSGDGPPAYEAFATGWLDPMGELHGRPVDVQPAADGALLVSDDKAGVIYRITWQGPRR